MDILNIFSLIGGLTLFLYGIIVMNKNLTTIAGEKMKSIMLTLTKSRPRGYATGLGITMINQSSSATTVLEAALVGAGLMTFYQSVAVTLGAELGSTFLPHIIALPSITKLAPFLIAVGFFISSRIKKQKSINIALIVLGIGLLFMGMEMMSAALYPLREYPYFLEFMKRVEVPILGILLGIVLTMLFQSSGAICGITIAMAMSGTITLEQAIPLNLGAAVGTCLTAILGSIPLNWDAKRSAYIHVVFQTIGVIWVYALLLVRTPEGERFFIWLTRELTAIVFRTDNIGRQIAVGFSLMPIINHVLLFGIPKFLDAIIMLFEKAFPPRVREKPFSVKYLQEKLVDGSVDIALEMAKKEILVTADIVKSMFEKVDLALKNKDIRLIDEICEADLKIDLLHKAIIIFLAKISGKELDQEEAKRNMNYLYIEKELESIGDVIDKNLMITAKNMISLNMSFSEEGSKELEELHGKVMGNINIMIKSFREENLELAKKIAGTYSNIDENKYQLAHIMRLHKGLKVSVNSSPMHLNVINYYSRINKHVVSIAKNIVWLSKEISSVA